MANTSPAPKVFISYSHDTPSHKKWVGELASKLMANGVDVILDQWEIGPGDDVPKFMEKSVNDADRVIMVCTESYVRKADDGKGGVGYEAMIVTGELVQNLGTSKFIPILRQHGESCLVPKAVSTRFYINFNDDQKFDEQFVILLRELHKVRVTSKPPLGPNPFAGSEKDSGKEFLHSSSSDSKAPGEPAKFYGSAIYIARQNDVFAWRKLVRQAKEGIPEGISLWREKYERSQLTEQGLSQIALEGLFNYKSLFAVALAGVASGQERFENQTAMLDEVLYPKDWNRSGLTVIVGLPEFAAFVYQALHGATCLQNFQLSLAIRMARTRIERYSREKSVPLFKEHHIIGWPETMGTNSKKAWEFLWELPEHWTWLTEVFGDIEDYRIALCAYYLGLNILELVETVAEGKEGMISKGDIHFDIPVRVPLVGRETSRKSYVLLLHEKEQVRAIWKDRNVKEALLKELWPTWLGHLANLLSREFFPRDLYMPHRHLFEEI